MATQLDCRPGLGCSALLNPHNDLQHAPQPIYHPFLRNSTHTHLQVFDDAPESPLPDKIPVEVFDPSKAIKIPIILKSTDTTDDLMEKYLREKPELRGKLHLAFNGKPVPAKMSVRQLGVKSGAMFITFQRCIGG